MIWYIPKLDKKKWFKEILFETPWKWKYFELRNFIYYISIGRIKLP